MLGIGGGFRILRDFEDLSFCGHCGPCFIRIVQDYIISKTFYDERLTSIGLSAVLLRFYNFRVGVLQFLLAKVLNKSECPFFRSSEKFSGNHDFLGFNLR